MIIIFQVIFIPILIWINHVLYYRLTLIFILMLFFSIWHNYFGKSIYINIYVTVVSMHFNYSNEMLWIRSTLLLSYKVDKLILWNLILIVFNLKLYFKLFKQIWYHLLCFLNIFFSYWFYNFLIQKTFLEGVINWFHNI